MKKILKSFILLYFALDWLFLCGLSYVILYFGSYLIAKYVSYDSFMPFFLLLNNIVTFFILNLMLAFNNIKRSITLFTITAIISNFYPLLWRNIDRFVMFDFVMVLLVGLINIVIFRLIKNIVTNL